jgi:hypothetical protein
VNPTPFSLQLLITEAISSQLGGSDQADLADKDALIQETAERLLDEAFSSGRIRDATIAEMRAFSAGNSSMMVARLAIDLTLGVKIDTNPDVVAEADLLRRAGEDTSLPEATREAFPRIYAVDRVGPIYGYLMEDLSGHCCIERDLFEPMSNSCPGSGWTRLLG